MRRIFVSSTCQDLETCRAEVSKMILRLGQFPRAMEFFNARPGQPVNECLALVREADAVVVLVAHRYGWVPGIDEGGDGERSITWMEVEAAMASGKPVFSFLIDPSAPWMLGREQDELVDAVDQPAALTVWKRVRGLGEFRRKLSSETVRDTFVSTDDLKAKVSASLATWLLSEVGAPLPPAYGLALRQMRQVHRYLNPDGDFELTVVYEVKNVSKHNVALLFPDSGSFFVDQPGDLERRLQFRCEAIGGEPVRMDGEVSYTLATTDKVDGQQRGLTRVSWRPKVKPALRPGAELTYRCTVSTRGTEKDAFSAAGSYLGFMSPYATYRMSLRSEAPEGYRFDRATLTPYLRTEDGTSEDQGLVPRPNLTPDDRALEWEIPHDSVIVNMNYLLKFRMVPA